MVSHRLNQELKDQEVLEENSKLELNLPEKQLNTRMMTMMNLQLLQLKQLKTTIAALLPILILTVVLMRLILHPLLNQNSFIIMHNPMSEDLEAQEENSKLELNSLEEQLLNTRMTEMMNLPQLQPKLLKTTIAALLPILILIAAPMRLIHQHQQHQKLKENSSKDHKV